jgi:hypothetical protein
MLVRVNDNFPGVFGAYNERLHCVDAKRAGDEPFEVSDSVAKIQIHNGVLVAVGGSAPAAPAPVVADEAEAEQQEIAVKDYSGMSMNELRAEAKSRGINSKNKGREVLIKLLQEDDAEAEPQIGAEDPV